MLKLIHRNRPIAEPTRQTASPQTEIRREQ